MSLDSFSSAFAKRLSEFPDAVQTEFADFVGVTIKAAASEEYNKKISIQVNGLAAVCGVVGVIEAVVAVILAGSFLGSGGVAPLFFAVAFAICSHDTFKISASLVSLSKHGAGGYFELSDRGILSIRNTETLLKKVFEGTIFLKPLFEFGTGTVIPYLKELE